MRRFNIKVLSCILGLVLFIFVFQSPAKSTLDEAQEDVERTRTEIAEFEKLIEDIENEINKRTSRIEDLGAELEIAQTELVVAKENMVMAEEDISKSFDLFSGRLRSAYMKHNVSYLEVLFQAESFADIIVWWVYLTRILENDVRIICLLYTSPSPRD